MKTTQYQELSPQATRLGASQFIRPDARVSPTSVFSDPVWYMAALVTTPGVSDYAKVWDFRRVPGFPHGFALSLAEYAYARLYTPVKTHEREGAWLTVFNELLVLAKFARLCSSLGLQRFDEVDDAICNEYLRQIRASDYTNESNLDARAKKNFQYIYRLWEYRSVVGNDLPTMPFGKPYDKLFKRRRSRSEPEENATPVIPEPIYAALMAAALDYVFTYSPSILKTWRRLQKHWDKNIGPLNLSLSMKYKRLAKASISIIVDNAYWLANGWSTYGDVYAELQQLRVACTIVVLAYSGIRSSELLALEAGCYVVDERADGHLRYYINTILHKHRERGARDTWVVVEEVVEAIKILETLTARARAESGDNRLMLTDSKNCFFSVHRSYVDVEVTEFTNGAVVLQLQEFQRHCNTKLSRLPIPEWTDVTGATATWQLNTRQFRRTLARYIARQPFGIIAGMLQYKHVEVAVFEGYAGSEPEWNKLLEQERVLASVDILEEVALDLSNGQLAGEFVIKLKEEFAAEFVGRAEDFPQSQIAKWLANSKKALFVGKFNFCFFDSAKALCTRGRNSDRPILNFCQPEECGNACVGKRHLPLWQAQLKQAEELALHSKASPYKRELLLHEARRLRDVVTNCGK